MPTEAEKKQKKLVLHGRIWFSGFIATTIFTLMMTLFEDDRSLRLGIIYFVVFYIIWVIMHYIFLRKHFNYIDRM